jgi:hypothetical protein
MKYILILSAILLYNCSNESLVVDNASDFYYSIVERDTILIVKNNHGGKEVYQIINGVKNGYYKLMDQSNSITEEGTISNGKKDGVIKKYKGTIISDMSYYKNDTFLFHLDKDDFAFDTLYFNDFSIRLPKLWITKLNPTTNVLCVCKKKLNGDSAYYNPSLSITSEESDLNISDYCKTAIDLIGNQVNQLTIVSKDEFELSGNNVLQIKYLIKVKETSIGFSTAFYKIGNVIYVLTCSASNKFDNEFLKYDGLYDKIVYSITPGKKV